MCPQHKIRGQEAKGFRVPVHAAADAVGRHERAPVADRQRGLVHLVAEREGGLLRTQEKFVANAVTTRPGHSSAGIPYGASRLGPRSIPLTSRPSPVTSLGSVEPGPP